MSKIGILGGTFNPIHLGHILLARTALAQANLEKIIFMPSGVSYMKRNMSILPAHERMKLVELSIMEYSQFESSDMEILRGGNTYTYETLEVLSSRSPGDELYFILGADCLYSMENWREPERIFRSCTVLAAVRDGVDQDSLKKKADDLKKKFEAKIRLLNLPRTDISSSEIRECLQQGKSISGMVAPAAEKYILERKLYSNLEARDEEF